MAILANTVHIDDDRKLAGYVDWTGQMLDGCYSDDGKPLVNNYPARIHFDGCNIAEVAVDCVKNAVIGARRKKRFKTLQGVREMENINYNELIGREPAKPLNPDNPHVRLAVFKSMLKDELITQEEFDRKARLIFPKPT